MEVKRFTDAVRPRANEALLLERLGATSFPGAPFNPSLRIEPEDCVTRNTRTRPTRNTHETHETHEMERWKTKEVMNYILSF